MRLPLLFVALLSLVPVASAQTNLVCEAEWFLYGGDEGCETLRDPTHMQQVAFCVIVELFAEDPAPCPEWEDVETNWGTWYIGGGHWVQQESNGCAGRQTMASDCDGDGDEERADHVVTLDDFL